MTQDVEAFDAALGLDAPARRRSAQWLYRRITGRNGPVASAREAYATRNALDWWFLMNLEAIQQEIRNQKLDGWLFFDHHMRDPLAYRVLGVEPPRTPT